MKVIAMPVIDGILTPHFGHCQAFALVTVDPDQGSVGEVRSLAPPAHAPGVLPRWLAEQGVDLVLAGGMGSQARQLLAAAGVEVIVGVAPDRPETLARAWLAGELPLGDNACDH